MPAGDAGLDLQRTFERNVARMLALNEQDMAELRAQIDQLLAQLAAQQAVVDAAREIEAVDHGLCYPDLAHALAALDKAQAAQPEGERG